MHIVQNNAFCLLVMSTKGGCGGSKPPPYGFLTGVLRREQAPALQRLSGGCGGSKPPPYGF